MRRSSTPRPSSTTPRSNRRSRASSACARSTSATSSTPSTQTGIVTIAQIEPIAVIFTAPEEQLPYINEAQAMQPLKVIALTTDGKKALSEGTLSVVNNQVDTTSGTIRLKAVFDNKDHALWPGQSVSTRLLVKTLKDATVVPDDAVQHGNRRPLRLCGRSRQQGRAAQDQGQPIDRRPFRGRRGPFAGRTCDHGRPIQGPAGTARSRRRWQDTEPAQAKAEQQ